MTFKKLYAVITALDGRAKCTYEVDNIVDLTNFIKTVMWNNKDHVRVMIELESRESSQK